MRAKGASLLRSRYFLFPFAVWLFKLQLNHTALFTAKPAYLRDLSFVSIFGVVLGLGSVRYRTYLKTGCALKSVANMKFQNIAEFEPHLLKGTKSAGGGI